MPHTFRPGASQAARLQGACYTSDSRECSCFFLTIVLAYDHWLLMTRLVARCAFLILDFSTTSTLEVHKPSLECPKKISRQTGDFPY